MFPEFSINTVQIPVAGPWLSMTKHRLFSYPQGTDLHQKCLGHPGRPPVLILGTTAFGISLGFP